MTDSVLAAIANGAAAGILLTIALCVALLAMPRRVFGANARHAAWCAAMITVMLLPLAYWPGGYGRAVSGQMVILKHTPAPPVGLPQANLRNMRVRERSQTAGAYLKLPFTFAAGSWEMWFVAGWAVLSISMLARLAMSFIELARRKAEANLAPPALQELVDAALVKAGSKRCARVLRSKDVAAPALAGVWKPAILIPDRLCEQLTTEEMSQIVMHEATHLARWDDWGLLASRVAVSLLPFHPAALWIVREIDCEREMACDDAVVANVGDARNYAACLIRVAELCSGANVSWAAAGAMGRRGQWMKRVETLLDRKLDNATRTSKSHAWATICIVAGIGLMACRMPDAIALKRVQTNQRPKAFRPAKVVAYSGSAPQPYETRIVLRPRTMTRTDSVVTVAPEVSEGRTILRPRTGTRTTSFVVWDAAVSQPAVSASQAVGSDSKSEPETIELVIDTSGSMRDRQQLVDTAIMQLVRAANAADEFLLVNFNSDVKVAGVFGNDAGQILDRQHLTPARGGTSLRDAIVLAEEWSQARHPRREIVVISDGSDNSSSESTARLRNDVKKTGIPIWAITFADPAAYPNHESEWLREIVTSTGGAEFVALDPKQIEAFATAIAK